MSTVQEPTLAIVVTPVAATEVLRFMEAEGVPVEKGGLRVSVQPGGCSGFKYGLLIEDQAADEDFVVDVTGFRIFVDPFSAQYHDDDFVVDVTGFRMFVDPFSAQYLSGVT